VIITVSLYNPLQAFSSRLHGIHDIHDTHGIRYGTLGILLKLPQPALPGLLLSRKAELTLASLSTTIDKSFYVTALLPPTLTTRPTILTSFPPDLFMMDGWMDG
jgi:hypothetical protein